MNSIMKSWHGKGLHTLEEIQKGDRRNAPRTASAPEKTAAKPTAEAVAANLSALQRLKEGK
jgi:hypothetical protein